MEALAETRRGSQHTLFTAQGACCCDEAGVSALLTSANSPVSRALVLWSAPMSASATSDARSPYSIAVAPFW